MDDARLELRERIGERGDFLDRALEQEEAEPLGRLGPDAGQALKRVDQARDRLRVVRHQISILCPASLGLLTDRVARSIPKTRRMKMALQLEDVRVHDALADEVEWRRRHVGIAWNQIGAQEGLRFGHEEP